MMQAQSILFSSLNPLYLGQETGGASDSVQELFGGVVAASPHGFRSRWALCRPCCSCQLEHSQDVSEFWHPIAILQFEVFGDRDSLSLFGQANEKR